MSDETATPQSPDDVDSTEGSTQETSAKGAGKAEREILDELGRLGTAFVQAVQAAWASDERKKLEQDLSAGLRSLADNVEEALEKVGKNEQLHDVLDKAEDVAESVGERVRDSKVTSELKEGLVKGLTALTEQMQRLSQEIATRQSAAQPTPKADTPEPSPASPDEPQDIPIQEG